MGTRDKEDAHQAMLDARADLAGVACSWRAFDREGRNTEVVLEDLRRAVEAYEAAKIVWANAKDDAEE